MHVPCLQMEGKLNKLIKTAGKLCFILCYTHSSFMKKVAKKTGDGSFFLAVLFFKCRIHMANCVFNFFKKVFMVVISICICFWEISGLYCFSVQNHSLRKKCPSTNFFLFFFCFFFSYFPVFCPNAGKCGPEKTLDFDNFHAVLLSY